MIWKNAIVFLGILAISNGCAESLESRLDDETADAADTGSTDGSDTSDGDDSSGDDTTGDATGDDSTAPGGDTTGDNPVINERIENRDEGNGVTLSVFEAVASNDWVFLDFETQREMALGDEGFPDAWDIAFQRYRPKINGGFHGDGNVMAAVLVDTTFADVTQAPETGWVTDAPDVDDDQDEFPEYALGEWFDYNIVGHILTPKPQVYVLRTAEGNFVKLEFVAYYSDVTGESGYPSIRWALIDAPEGDITEPDFGEVGAPATDTARMYRGGLFDPPLTQISQEALQ